MATNGNQKNPGGLPYGVINDNRFDLPDATVQQCKSLDEAWKALTSIRPKGSSTDAPMTAQPLHDVLAFVLAQLAGNKKRSGALYAPGLWPGAQSYLGVTGASSPGHHVHFKYENGRWIPTTGEYQATDAQAYQGCAQWQAGQVGTAPSLTKGEPSHTHTVDFGQLPPYIPIFFHPFDPPMPRDGFIRGSYQNQRMSIQFHVCQRPLKGAGGILEGVDLTDGRAVMVKLYQALQDAGHQVWTGDFSSVVASRSPEETGRLPQDPNQTVDDMWPWGTGLGWTCNGSGSLTSDVFGLKKLYNWGFTYEIHLTYWMYKAFFPGLVDLPPGGTQATMASYDVNPYGINFWPGDMSRYFPADYNQAHEYDICDIAARWMGRDATFNFDEFVKEQIWGKDGQPYTAAQKNSYYQAYILAMDNHLKYNNGYSDILPPSVKYYKRFTADGRVHPNRCIVPLHFGFTVTYDESLPMTFGEWSH